MIKPISDRLLRRFSASDIADCGDWTPKTIGRYTYATNGMIMIRVPAMAKYPRRTRSELRGVERLCEKIIPPMTGLKFVPLVLTGKPLCINTYCHRCDGAKRVLHDGKREDCTVCGGTGRASTYDPVPFRNTFIAWHYLYLISLLPNPHVAAQPKATDNIPFRFIGGAGVVAPKLPT